MDTRRKIIREFDSYKHSFYDFEGIIEDIKAKLIDAQEDGWERIQICEDCFSDAKYLRYCKDRVETDEEYAARIALEMRNREKEVFGKARLEKKAKEARRNLYEQLKKEFENE